MAYTNSADFGRIFSDLINGASKNNNGNFTFTDVVSSDCEDDVEDCKDYKEEYDKLKEEFDSYRKRVNNTLETEKRQLKRDLLKSFLNEFVVFLVNTYKGKKVVNNSMTDEDYLILKKMNDFLETMGVSPMPDCTGKEFDYRTMEGICKEPREDMEAGHVSKVIYNGFMIGDEVLIPTRVSVSVKPQ